MFGLVAPGFGGMFSLLEPPIFRVMEPPERWGCGCLKPSIDKDGKRAPDWRRDTTSSGR
jgi:hypothetical protein